MNQLQSQEVIRQLYRASQAGVPIKLNVRGLSCLRPGVSGLSESIRVFGLVGRFLDHSRIYRFTNGGEPEYFIGSADWMKRNLESRVETIAPIFDPKARAQIDRIIEIYDLDNTSVWDCRPDGHYVRRRPREGEPARAAQEMLSREATGDRSPDSVSLEQVS
jgi:polyphosphate kinase